MKKLLSIILTATMLLTALTLAPTVGAKAKEYKSKRCVYTLDKKGNAKVIDYYGDVKTFPKSYWKIPSSLNGHRVTGIDLKWRILPDKIRIPSTVNYISSSIKEYVYDAEYDYDGSHDITRIVCDRNSYAHKYSKKYKLDYIFAGDSKTCGDLSNLISNYGYEIYYEKNKKLYNAFSSPLTLLYNGKPHTPKIKIKKDKYTLKEGTDYTVQYFNNCAVGNSSIVVLGKGDYWGGRIINFSIIPTQAEIVSLWQKGETKVECRYKSKTYAYPYQMIQYSTDKTFKTKKSVSSSLVKKEVITGLEKGKTYYFRVAHYVDTSEIYVGFENYRKDPSKLYMDMSTVSRFYGKWSEVKSITL